VDLNGGEIIIVDALPYNDYVGRIYRGASSAAPTLAWTGGATSTDNLQPGIATTTAYSYNNVRFTSVSQANASALATSGEDNQIVGIRPCAVCVELVNTSTIVDIGGAIRAIRLQSPGYAPSNTSNAYSEWPSTIATMNQQGNSEHISCAESIAGVCAMLAPKGLAAQEFYYPSSYTLGGTGAAAWAARAYESYGTSAGVSSGESPVWTWTGLRLQISGVPIGKAASFDVIFRGFYEVQLPPSSWLSGNGIFRQLGDILPVMREAQLVMKRGIFMPMKGSNAQRRSVKPMLRLPPPSTKGKGNGRGKKGPRANATSSMAQQVGKVVKDAVAQAATGAIRSAVNRAGAAAFNAAVRPHNRAREQARGGELRRRRR